MTKHIDTTKVTTAFALSTLFCSGCLFTQDPSGDGVGVTPSQDMGIIPTQDMPADQSEPQDLGDTPDEGIAPDDLGAMPDISTPDDMNQGIVCGDSICEEGQWCDEEDETNITCRNCPNEDPEGTCPKPSNQDEFLCGERPRFESMYMQCGFSKTTCECPEQYHCDATQNECATSCITDELINRHCIANPNITAIQAMCEFGFETYECGDNTTIEDIRIKLATQITEPGVLDVGIGEDLAFATASNELKIYQKEDGTNRWIPFTKLNSILDQEFPNTSYTVKPVAAISQNDILAFYLTLDHTDKTEHKIVTIGPPTNSSTPDVLKTYSALNAVNSIDIKNGHLAYLTNTGATIQQMTDTSSTIFRCLNNNLETLRVDSSNHIQLIQNKIESDPSSVGAVYVIGSPSGASTQYNVVLCTNNGRTLPEINILGLSDLNENIPIKTKQNKLYLSLKNDPKAVTEYIMKDNTISSPTNYNVMHEFTQFDASYNDQNTFILSNDPINESVYLNTFTKNSTGGQFVSSKITYQSVTEVSSFGSSVALPQHYPNSQTLIIGEGGPAGNVHFATSKR